MHIQFNGKISAVAADLISRTAKVTIKGNIKETNKDAIEELASLTVTKMPAYINLEATDQDGYTVGSPGWVVGCKGDFPTDTLTVTFQFSLSDIRGEPERYLAAMAESEWAVLAEVSNQQMSFRDLDTVEMSTVDKETGEIHSVVITGQQFSQLAEARHE